MTHVALLRGINVGGKNKVEMARLRQVVSGLGHEDVRTYINSGNVIFNSAATGDITSPITSAIEDDFGFRVEVLVRDLETMEMVERAIPARWVDDKTMRTYVMFLWEDVDDPSIVDGLPTRAGIDNVLYARGAIIWQVDRQNLTRSGMGRVAASALYKSMTVRNANTVRKLADMMRQTAAGDR